LHILFGIDTSGPPLNPLGAQPLSFSWSWSSSSSWSSSIAFLAGRARTTTTTSTIRKLPRLTVIVLVVVLVVDCLPRRQNEDDDDHEDDQETPASTSSVHEIWYPFGSTRVISQPSHCWKRVKCIRASAKDDFATFQSRKLGSNIRR
jgi:hypothetical protein